MERKNLICIVCPMGCRLSIEINEKSEKGYKVIGSKCKRGENYAIKELTNPTRMITSTVKINNGTLPRIPVKTNGDIPKSLIFDCMNVINEVKVKAPIKIGDVIVKNILDTGIDLVTSRSMNKVTSSDTFLLAQAK